MRIRIQEAQKHPEPTDADPQHCFKSSMFTQTQGMWPPWKLSVGASLSVLTYDTLPSFAEVKFSAKIKKMIEIIERAPDINALTSWKSILDILIEAGGFWLDPLKARKLRADH